MGIISSVLGILCGIKKEKREPHIKKMKRIIADKNLDLETKLKEVYKLRNEESAFWWYENSIKKPNTGSKENIEKLHTKFLCLSEYQLESLYYSKAKTGSVEQMKDFVRMTLPDIDYKKKGFEDKEACLEEMFKQWQPLRLFICKRFNNSSRYDYELSPYYTPAYWSLFNEKVELHDIIQEFLNVTNCPLQFQKGTDTLIPKM